MERFSNWSPEREAIERLIDRVGNLVQAVIASGGSRPPRIDPGNRPESAVQRLRRNARITQQRALAARILPKKN